jgi:hypothetical protein
MVRPLEPKQSSPIENVKISGFYELIPPGETGNEAGIIANVPADKALGEK